MTTESENQPVQLPPGQQLVAAGKWPVIGQRLPDDSETPWQLSVTGAVENPLTLSLGQLRGLPQHVAEVDIHCVTRWSKLGAKFAGVLTADLLGLAQPKSGAKFLSFVSRTANKHSSSIEIEAAVGLQAMIALSYQDQPLAVGHGGPIRSIIPGRYFYKSVKWVATIEVLTVDRLGNWEAESGYHNLADPWQQQRYMGANLDKRTAAKLIDSRDFSGHDLRSIDCCKMRLPGLNAGGASLRDAKFVDADLSGANFENANLSNAYFESANLTNANFRGADVEGADFAGADLRGADFSGASLVGASFFRDCCDAAAHQVAADSLAAKIDTTSVLPDEVVAKLFPRQLQFVRRCLGQTD